MTKETMMEMGCVFVCVMREGEEDKAAKMHLQQYWKPQDQVQIAKVKIEVMACVYKSLNIISEDKVVMSTV